MNRSGGTAYRLVFAPEVRQPWEQVPSRHRMPLQRALEEAARTVGQRQWVSEVEAEELFVLTSGPYELHYRLEPGMRVLTVTGLRKGAGSS